MVNRPSLWRIALIIAVGVVLTACNLGEPTFTEPVDISPTPDLGIQQPLDNGSGQANDGSGAIDQPNADVPTLTPAIDIPPTNTPVPELLPWEKLGPITIDGLDHRTQEPITVRVTRGSQVDNVTCFWELQGIGETQTLVLSSSTQSADNNTFVDVYSFTPEAAGTYLVNCTGTANTGAGPQGVNAKSQTFTVEAKG